MRRAITPFVLGAILVAGCGVDASKKKARKSGSTSAATTSQSTTPPILGITNLPEARAQHTAVVLPSGDIFVAGGVDANGNLLASTVIITSNTVIPGPDMSTPRLGHTATYDASTRTVILAGGQSDAQGTVVLDSSDVFDPSTNTISSGPTLAWARTHHTAVLYPAQAGLQVLFAGGLGAAVTGPPAFLNNAEVLDVSSGTSTLVAAALSEAQMNAQGVMLDTGDLLIISGQGANGPAAADLYDPNTRTFTPVAGAAAVFGAAVASHGREVYLAGGATGAAGTIAVDRTEIFDSASQSFVAGPTLPVARANATGSRLSSGIAVVGGATALAVSDLVEVISGTPLTVAAGPSLVTARWAHTASVRGADHVVVVGGYDASGIVTDSIEDLDLSALVSPTTPPVAAPPGSITSYPYFEDFAAGAGAWTDSTADDFDWTANAGGTPSLDTGPQADHTGGGQYLYTESSYPNDTNKVAIIEGPTFANFGSLEMRFWYHMLGNPTGFMMGTLSLDVSTDGGQTWTLDEWTLTGTQGAAWLEAVVDLSAYAGQALTVRFRGVTASFNSDMSIDDISVSDVPGPVTPPPPPPPAPPAATAFPYAENFDAGFGLWKQVNTDDFDWDQNTGATGSTNTGPTDDHTSGTGSYLYTESSYPNDTNKIAILEGPTFANFSSLELRFWYHMLGDTTGQLMGSLSLDVSTDGGQTWTLDEWTLTGTQGANWLEAAVDLSAYAGQSVTLRFRGVTASYRSDMAIDDVAVTGTP